MLPPINYKSSLKGAFCPVPIKVVLPSDGLLPELQKTNIGSVSDPFPKLAAEDRVQETICKMVEEQTSTHHSDVCVALTCQQVIKRISQAM
ncbi:hypothetical protein RRG08_051323 [Elysia crispata]|uniref:Uncharacterized protein n=1 Tax=Elysia crispata TaxID=231223 RepID=A0AAE1B447_9GAST|nr:hypothetical protein RRG08_051323 [Elysia crispata]